MKAILIIEDNAELQALYARALTTAGYEVHSVTNVAQAGTELQEKKPDVIILDIMLPGGQNGFDLLETIKKDPETAQIPVIVLTNLDSEEKVAREIGAADYIVKSNVSMDQVIERVQKVCPT
jgi:two-component system, OmpR family, phosphate regulon response regulator PhoB